MTWRFPVAAGTPIQVRLYFANQCPCTDEPGDRVFDVDIEGAEAIDELDMTDDHGHQTAIAYTFDIVSDGAVDVVLRHVVENPLINGIEIVQTGVAGGAITSDDDVKRRFLDPATGADTPAVTTGNRGVAMGPRWVHGRLDRLHRLGRRVHADAIARRRNVGRPNAHWAIRQQRDTGHV